MKTLAFLLVALQLLTGCAIDSVVLPRETLARAHTASDMASYRVQRVAVVPFTGATLDPERAMQLENGLAIELAPRVPFELVQLSAADLAEISRADPYRRGWYASTTLLEIAARFQVDAILVGTVREWSLYTPQRLATQIELVSCETGMVAWSSTVELDADDARVVASVKAWYAFERDSHDAPGDEALAFLSPSSFARFAMRELARSYE
ncbi:MAG TPA: hypothetical protein VK843_23380 [Planctomycetota bacterium]|nr:hypothetical protein [Planctomycetota bacterium]